jgi:large subunit ribosomal protein L30
MQKENDGIQVLGDMNTNNVINRDASKECSVNIQNLSVRSQNNKKFTDVMPVQEVISVDSDVTTNLIKVTQVGSAIGRKYDQEQTLIGLGLNKLHRTKLLENTSSIRGMIRKVQHLITVEFKNL